MPRYSGVKYFENIPTRWAFIRIWKRVGFHSIRIL